MLVGHRPSAGRPDREPHLRHCDRRGTWREARERAPPRRGRRAGSARARARRRIEQATEQQPAEAVQGDRRGRQCRHGCGAGRGSAIEHRASASGVELRRGRRDDAPARPFDPGRHD